MTATDRRRSSRPLQVEVLALFSVSRVLSLDLSTAETSALRFCVLHCRFLHSVHKAAAALFVLIAPPQIWITILSFELSLGVLTV